MKAVARDGTSMPSSRHLIATRPSRVPDLMERSRDSRASVLSLDVNALTFRPSRDTGKTKAVIYDFFVVPPPFGDRFGPSGRRWERSLFSRELRRILEFCACADNGISERTKLLDLRQEYDLMDL